MLLVGRPTDLEISNIIINVSYQSAGRLILEISISVGRQSYYRNFKNQLAGRLILEISVTSRPTDCLISVGWPTDISNVQYQSAGQLVTEIFISVGRPTDKINFLYQSAGRLLLKFLISAGQLTDIRNF